MKIVINGEVFDSNDTPIVIIFEGYDDLAYHSKNLINMQAGCSATEHRVYCCYPDGMPKEIIAQETENAEALAGYIPED